MRKKPFINSQRLDEIIEVGIVDGGDLFRILAITYGPNRRMIRAQFLLPGVNHGICVVDQTTPLADVLDELIAIAVRFFKLNRAPPKTIHSGPAAMKWVARFITEIRTLNPLANPFGKMKITMTLHIRKEKLELPTPQSDS